MRKELQDAREDYRKDRLDLMDLADDPITQFSNWFDEYKELKERDFNAMMLTTNTIVGGSTGRIVLLKGMSEEGFEFFTNYNSDKAKEIEHQPMVSLVFFWASMERQVRIEGKAVKLSAKESDAYFKVRPRGSQIGAWVSPQSEIIESRKVLEDNVIKWEKEFEGMDVPRPDNWGGYRVVPLKMEFWQGRSSRLHDRYVYEQNGVKWLKMRKAP